MGSSRLCRSAALVTVALAALGCGNADLARVTGKVVFPDETPLKGGTIIFNPADRDNLAAQAVIQPDGTFRLGTRKTGDGARPGKYVVAIEPADDKAPDGVDARFHNPRTSGLEYTVVAGTNDFKITVHKKKGKGKKK